MTLVEICAKCNLSPTPTQREVHSSWNHKPLLITHTVILKEREKVERNYINSIPKIHNLKLVMHNDRKYIVYMPAVTMTTASDRFVRISQRQQKKKRAGNT